MLLKIFPQSFVERIKIVPSVLHWERSRRCVWWAEVHNEWWAAHLTHAPPTRTPNVGEFTGDMNLLKCHRVQTPQISKGTKKIHQTNYYQQARKKYQINFFVHLGFDLSAEATNTGFHLMAILVALSVTCPSIYSLLPLASSQ